MDRLWAFEQMMDDISHQVEREQTEMEKLKAAGKEKNGNLSAIFWESAVLQNDAGQVQAVRIAGLENAVWEDRTFLR